MLFSSKEFKTDFAFSITSFGTPANLDASSHRIVKGGTNKSYGIEAAKLSGVPKEVIEKAKSVLNSLEENNKLNYDIK